MKNKQLIISLLLAGSIGLSACGNASSSSGSSSNGSQGGTTTSSSSVISSSGSSSSVIVKDDVITYIKIKDGSISTKFILNAEVNYDSLAIETYNKSDELIHTMTYAKNKKAFSFDRIDTSTEVNDATFEVKVTINTIVFTASVKYSVAKTYDKTATKIVVQGVSNKYYVGDELDLSKITISVQNKDSIELEKVKGNAAGVTCTGFDSTKAGNIALVFSYDSLSSTINTIVYEAERRFTPTNWTANSKYTTFQNELKNVSTEKDGQHNTSFLETTSFYLGNYNAVNLMPVINAIDPADNDKSITYQSMYDVTAKLFTQESETELTLADYFDDVNLLLTKGEVNFKDTVTGKFNLRFIYPSENKESFPDLSYDLDVIDGYNVNNATELFALDNTDLVNRNQEDLSTPTGGLKDFKEKNNLPVKNFANGIIQADISLDANNIPSSFLWTEESIKAAGGSDMTLAGTFRDYLFLVNHIPSLNQKTFGIYGNCHKISLSELPMVEADANAKRPENGVPVESHAAVFGFDIEQFRIIDGFDDYKVFVRDLSSTGNQQKTATADYTKSGLCYLKTFVDTTVINCISGQYYLAYLTGGHFDSNASSNTAYVDTAPNNPELNITSTRIYDTSNCHVFNYKETNVNIFNSEMRDSGGPLIINQSAHYDPTDRKLAAAYKKANGTDPRHGSWINIDSSTVLVNQVTGQGGWFKINGAESGINQLKTLDPLFNAQLQKTFLKSTTVGETTTSTVNLVAVNMLASSTSDTETGAFYGGTKIGSNDIVDYESGREALETAVSNIASDSGASYATELGKSDYSSLYLLSNASSTPLFKTQKDGVSSYASVYSATPADTSTLRLTKPSYDMTSNPVTLLKGSTDFGSGSDNYMGIYTLGSAQGGNPADPTKYSEYEGANCFGVVVTLSDYSA